MDKNKLNMSDLEKEMASSETDDAVVEEQYNADQIYASLDNELEEIIAQIPYPHVKKYTTGINNYENIEKIQYEKSRNIPYWEKQEELERYCNNGSLYIGHLNANGNDYYFIDNPLSNTKSIITNNAVVRLINVEDRSYSDYIRLWHYPSEHPNVQFSRNITMQNREVYDVDIIFDKGTELYSVITDAYLRKALIRNKSKGTAQSIIQTIQKKQDNIRSLHKDKSFIVQGCAGSGKTMVLLHRLRYLLYNKDIYTDEYVFLVPSHSFKEFINEISTNFRINSNNILTYQNYYQSILGKKTTNNDIDKSELVFDSKYLDKVYSKKFIQETYSSLFKVFFDQTEKLISFCEDMLNYLLEREVFIFEKEISNSKSKAIELSVEAIQKIQNYTLTKLENEFNNIQILIEEIEKTYSQRKKEYEFASNPSKIITISPDDERILSNKYLSELKKGIDAENIALEKASLFTLFSHKSKLKKLKENYDSEYKNLVNTLIEEDKAKYAKQATQLIYVYENVTFSEIEKILETLKKIVSSANSTIENAQKKLDSINEYLGERFASEIDLLNKMIVISGEITSTEKEYVENLLPSYSFFEQNLSLGTKLLSRFSKYITDDSDKNFVKNNLSLFAPRTSNQLYAYLNMLLFNACKKQISTDFGIKICDVYKHYWYLNLYCNYLTKPLKAEEKKFIFIDEAQDLSISEIELINKVNSITSKPAINLFGDINQMITSHGIKEWAQVSIIKDIFFLDENFRNTNQIVDYCNRKLSMKMVKIGVDMENVSEYISINDAVNKSNSIFNNAVFIVKDDYSVSDLKSLLISINIDNYEIYTVKTAKGLEFKEIFVFDSDMSPNEKYISYTRALAKLNIIKTLPQSTDRTTSLIIQGNESEDGVNSSEDNWKE